MKPPKFIYLLIHSFAPIHGGWVGGLVGGGGGDLEDSCTASLAAGLPLAHRDGGLLGIPQHAASLLPQPACLRQETGHCGGKLGQQRRHIYFGTIVQRYHMGVQFVRQPS